MSTEEDSYTGPATLLIEEESFAVTVHLYCQFQPLDGRYHWYGRIARDEILSRRIGSNTRPAVLAIDKDRAYAQVGNPDIGNRYRIEGTGYPPFRIARQLSDIENSATE